MKHLKIYLTLIVLSLSLSSCFIELPEVEETPYLITDGTTTEGNYIYVDSAMGLRINVYAGYYFSDTTGRGIFSAIELNVKNCGQKKVLFDSSSVTLESDSFISELIYLSPEKVLLAPTEDTELRYLFRSKVSANELDKSQELLVKLFTTTDGNKKLITKFILKKNKI